MADCRVARMVPHEAGRTWLARYEGASSTLDMGRRPSIVRPGSRVPYVPGAALVVRKQAAGIGFAEDMQVGEDVDFVWRLAASGWRVRYEPAATMGHQHRVRLREWLSRRKDYGTSAATLEQRHPGAVRPLYASAWTAAAWLAAAFAVRRLRLPLAALVLVPPLLDWLDRRPPLDPARYVAARLLDDAGYSVGVWQGCAERRTVRPLLPVLRGRGHLCAVIFAGP